MVTRPLSHVKGKNSSREQGNRNYYSNNKSNRLMCVKGGSRSRFTENKTVLSQFTKNKDIMKITVHGELNIYFSFHGK